MFAPIALALTLLSSASLASVADDIARIRPLLSPGSDVAQIQANILRGESEGESAEFAKDNYLFRDLNGDGLEDLLVIDEVNPTLIDYSNDTPCETYDPSRCSVSYNKRSLKLFLGQRDGSLKLSLSNDKFVLGGDEGGVFGDPLNGFAVKKSGAIMLSVYGGSAWRWSYSDTMQFRKGAFYVIGQDSYHGWTGDLRSETKSVNLVTGEVEVTSQKTGDAPVKTRRYKIAVKPLVKVADYSGQQ